MLTTKQFNANLKKLNDEQMRATVSECFAYCLFHYFKDGQKTPFKQLQDAVSGSKSFLADMVGKLKLGNRVKDGDLEHIATMRADAEVAVIFASQSEKREISRQNRKAREEAKAKIEAPKTEQVAAPVLKYGFVFEGELIEVSQDEAIAIQNLITRMRAPAPLRLAA